MCIGIDASFRPTGGFVGSLSTTKAAGEQSDWNLWDMHRLENLRKEQQRQDRWVILVDQWGWSTPTSLRGWFDIYIYIYISISAVQGSGGSFQTRSIKKPRKERKARWSSWMKRWLGGGQNQADWPTDRLTSWLTRGLIHWMSYRATVTNELALTDFYDSPQETHVQSEWPKTVAKRGFEMFWAITTFQTCLVLLDHQQRPWDTDVSMNFDHLDFQIALSPQHGMVQFFSRSFANVALAPASSSKVPFQSTKLAKNNETLLSAQCFTFHIHAALHFWLTLLLTLTFLVAQHWPQLSIWE